MVLVAALKYPQMAVWQVTTPPAAEPLVLDDLRTWLRLPVSFTSEDDLIEDLITDARVFIERHTARALITQTITEYFDEFPSADRATKPLDARIIKLHIAPVVSITSVSYIASDGDPSNYSTWDNTGNAAYFLDNISGANGIGPARICKKKGVTWPEIEAYPNAVKVVYVAGYGASGASVPGPLKKAIYRLVGRWYYGRKGNEKDDFELVSDLLKPYQVHK